jgi:hypothetical protein
MEGTSLAHARAQPEDLRQQLDAGHRKLMNQLKRGFTNQKKFSNAEHSMSNVEVSVARIRHSQFVTFFYWHTSITLATWLLV